MNTKARLTSAAHFRLLKNDQVSRRLLLRWAFVLHKLLLYVSLFNVRINEEMLKWTQLFFKILIIDFIDSVDGFVRISICCFDKKAILSVLMLSQSVKPRKLMATKFIF